VDGLPVLSGALEGVETTVELLSGILYWLLVWFLAGIPASLVLAQLLKAASEQLEREESARLLGIRIRQN
jgi:hypothetical protein